MPRPFSAQKINVIEVTYHLLKLMRVRFLKKSLKKNILAHPDYPSLLAVNDCLNDWKIDSFAFKIDSTRDFKNTLRFPFIAYINKNSDRFILVKSAANGIVVYADEKNDENLMAENEFLETWDGITLNADVNEQSGEPDFINNKIEFFLKRYMLPISAVFFMFCLLPLLPSDIFELKYLILTVIKLLGFSISILLLMQTVNFNHSFTKNICRLTGENGCRDILESESAKVTPWMSWSEVGFFYFSGTFIFLLLSVNWANILPFLNLLALPFTIYSISYQIKNKKWCVLCTMIQVLLWAEAMTFYFLFDYAIVFNSVSVQNIAIFVISFLLPVLFWAFLKQTFVNSALIKPLKHDLSKFKNNFHLFNQFLISQERYDFGDDLRPILLGDENSDNIITVISNPLCEPCAKAHKFLDELMDYKSNIQLRIIFATSNDDNDPRAKVARHLCSLNILDDKSIVKDALKNWYGSKNKEYDLWASKYPHNIIPDAIEIIQKQKEWCAVAKIQFTPTFLINGYKLPEPYTIEDMKFFLN